MEEIYLNIMFSKWFLMIWRPRSITFEFHVKVQCHYSGRNSPGVRPNGMSGSPLDGLMGKRILFSTGPGVPSSPETFRYSMVEVPLATLLHSKARFLMDFWIASFASILASIVDRCWISLGTMLALFCFDFRIIFRASILHRFGIDFIKKCRTSKLWFYYQMI